MVRAADKKSPREAVEFVLQLLKYNDNSGNPYSDVYWLAALVQSIGELEFGQQSIPFLSSLLKRIDRLLQFDRLMPSYNGILTISCIRSLAQIALKLSSSVPLDRVSELIKPFRGIGTLWKVRIEASRALLDLEFHCKGIDAALLLFIKYIEEETSLRGEVKLAVHAMRLCQIRSGSGSGSEIKSSTLVLLLRLFESRAAFSNVFLRHHLFCILQILSGRPPTLYGVPRTHLRPPGEVESCTKLKIPMPPDPPMDAPKSVSDALPIKEADTVSNTSERRRPIVKIRVKQSSSRVDEAENSSMSVDAPIRITDDEPVNVEEVNSCNDRDSHMTASVKPINTTTDEVLCTADSKDNGVETDAQRYASLQTLSVATPLDIVDRNEKKEKRRKDKEKKRKEKDPEYLERKRLKKEKKKKKEMIKLQNMECKVDSAEEARVKPSAMVELKPNEASGSKLVIKTLESKGEEGSSIKKFRIKIKNRSLNTS